MRPPRSSHLLTFDIEDWFHLVDIPYCEETSRWASLPSLVERETRAILDQLRPRGVRATFFIVGWIAERYPDLVREIAAAGHEVGCHSYWHRPVYRLDTAAFSDDTRRAMDVLSAITGERIRGYRAPSFSLVPGTEWALEVLADAGIEYDASVFPARRPQGGYPSFPNHPHAFELPDRRILPELPMTLFQWGRWSLAFSGGGYLRLLPYQLIASGIRWLERRGTPAMVYLHPRDFAPDCPRAPMPLSRRFRSYVGLRTTREKLRRLLDDFPFLGCAEFLRLWDAPGVPGPPALPPHRVAGMAGAGGRLAA